MKSTCELLAPAGNMASFRAAVENGADAVYLGGRTFNARINAENFTDEEISEAVKYAHLRNVKVYVTLNTLLFDDELEDALKYAAGLYETGVDALIVQDLGIARLIRKHVPDFELHLSTQGTVYNESGVRMAKKLGFERVVLARELSLKEIEKICRADICEIEVFVHGALCMCYSGQCQLSRVIGGRSGNRGQCAQPCRLPYKNEKGEIGYWLSPKDFCAVDYLADYVRMGVKSLKIEGRMKSPEYVGAVTAIYRKYLNECIENGSCEVSERDRTMLEQIYSRNGFTTGYLLGNPGRELLSGKVPKHKGIKVGKVLSVAQAGKSDRKIARVQLSDRLEMGDTVEFRTPENRMKISYEHISYPGGIVSYIKSGRNNLLDIGDFKEAPLKGDEVFRISSKKQLDEVRSTYEKGGIRKVPVAARFYAAHGEIPELELSEGNITVHVKGDEPAETAFKRALDRESVLKQLSKMGDTCFELADADVYLGDDTALAASKINALRRNALELLEQEKLKTGRAKVVISSPETEKLKKFNIPENEDVPHFSKITRGKEDAYISEHFDELASRKSVILENLGWADEFLEKGVKVYGGEGLNITNGEAAEALKSVGIEPMDVSPEMKESPLDVMTVEFEIPARELTDRKGKKFLVEDGRFGDKRIIREK